MNGNGVPRKLARKVAWAVAMSTAAYGIEAIWEDQAWLLNGFHRLTTEIGRRVAGTFSSTKGEDAIRAADIPPTRPALDRRRERLLSAALSATPDAPKRALIPVAATDDSSRSRVSTWFREASRNLLKEGQQVEKTSPMRRHRTPWHPPEGPTLHAWTDGSFRKSAGVGWVISSSNDGSGEIIAWDSKSLGGMHTAFDAEVTAIQLAIYWFITNRHGARSLVVHSDSTSAIERAAHTGAGPGQSQARKIQRWVQALARQSTPRWVNIEWVKGHAGTPGNERADALAGSAAETAGPYSPVMSLAFLKMRISDKFRTAKDGWHNDPSNHGLAEIPPPPPKKSMLDRARNAIARTAAQIRTGHWRSAVYLKRIRKPGYTEDACWFCNDGKTMSRSHVLLHCKNPKIAGARLEAWEGKNPGGVRVLLANPRWERRFVRFLELSGVGRTMKDGTDEESAYATRMDGWVAWEARRGREERGEG